jgi:hypothetical protein
MPNNRQWAVLLWLVVLVWLPQVRSSLPGILRAALPLLAPVAMMVAWVSGLVYVAAEVGLWDMELATDTAFWFVFAGLVLFGGIVQMTREERFFRRKAFAVLEIGVAVEVFSEFFVFNLLAEVLVVQPVLAALVVMSAVAGLRTEHRHVKAVCDWLLVSVTLVILGFVAVSLLNNWGATDKGHLLRELALPVWLTVGTLPFIYALGLVEAYRVAFRQIDWRSKANRWERAMSKLALLATFHMRAQEVGRVSTPLQFRLASTRSFREARCAIREVRQDGGPATTAA